MTDGLGPLGLPLVGPATVAMGVFDGVHRGHRHLLDATIRTADRHQARSVVVVFDPHPDEVIRPGTAVARLTPLLETCDLIRAAGIDYALTVRFDAALRDLEPEAFLDALAPALELRALVMTPESAFGHRRAGTLERMRSVGAERGFEAVAVETLQDGGEPISSSRVRRAVEAADLGEAQRLLGRAHRVIGTVVRGEGRGRALGFPTANLAFDYRPCLPPDGIYLARCSGPGGSPMEQPALASIGIRPTFHSGGPTVVEANLLDWSGDLYGATVRLELLEHLRDQERFVDAHGLVGQMREDERRARMRLASVSWPGRTDGDSGAPLVDSAGYGKECGGIRAARQGREERDR